MLSITALYAGLLGLLSIVIAVAAGAARGATGISIGDGGNEQVVIGMRRHANFIEFVPLGLILIGILELNGVGSTPIHALGGGLLFARAAHAMGFGKDSPLGHLRTVGALGSTLVMAIASVWAILTAL